jgi:hypothetical protein
MDASFFRRGSQTLKRLVLTSSLLCLIASSAFAECMSLVSGPVIVDVAGCKLLEPEKVFDSSKSKYKFIGDLDAAGRKQFLDTYRGLFIKVRVVKSQAVQKGLNVEEGALNGQTLYMYMAPSQNQCSAMLGKRVSATVNERCCDGGGDVPCLLDTGFVLKDLKVIGSTASGAGDESRQRAMRSPTYKAGITAFKAKKYKDAVAAFAKAKTAGELDIKGHYSLGFAYREMDQCGDAIPPLKYIYDASVKKNIWADEEDIARKAAFLLARCYSKVNDPGASVMILNSYLLEPQKYKTELKQGQTNKDFGWIHTSKEYRDWKKEAIKKLN